MDGSHEPLWTAAPGFRETSQECLAVLIEAKINKTPTVWAQVC